MDQLLIAGILSTKQKGTAELKWDEEEMKNAITVVRGKNQNSKSFKNVLHLAISNSRFSKTGSPNSPNYKEKYAYNNNIREVSFIPFE